MLSDGYGNGQPQIARDAVSDAFNHQVTTRSLLLLLLLLIRH